MTKLEEDELVNAIIRKMERNDKRNHISWATDFKKYMKRAVRYTIKQIKYTKQEKM